MDYRAWTSTGCHEVSYKRRKIFGLKTIHMTGDIQRHHYIYTIHSLRDEKMHVSHLASNPYQPTIHAISKRAAALRNGHSTRTTMNDHRTKNKLYQLSWSKRRRRVNEGAACQLWKEEDWWMIKKKKTKKKAHREPQTDKQNNHDRGHSRRASYQQGQTRPKSKMQLNGQTA